VEFIALLKANTNKTANIRTYSKKWLSTVNALDSTVLEQIGKIVSLMQHNIDSCLLCDGSAFSLLIYDFEPFMMDGNRTYYTLSALVRPLEFLEQVDKLEGKPMQIVVELHSGLVMNDTKALMEVGLLEDDQEADGDEPKLFGNFLEFDELYKDEGAFVAISSSTPLKMDDVMLGLFDNYEIILESTAYASFAEASYSLLYSSYQCHYIGQLSRPIAQFSTMLEEGLGGFILKLYDLGSTTSGSSSCKEYKYAFSGLLISALDQAERLRLSALEQSEQLRTSPHLC